MCVCPGMKVITTLLLAGLTGFLFGLLGCEKSPDSAEVCAAEIYDRLELVASPQPPCDMSIELYEVDGRYLYSYGSTFCEYVLSWYTCEGVRADGNLEEAREIRDRATYVKSVGFLPQRRSCVQETIDSLGLVEIPPTASCSTSVTLLRYDERTYFQYSSPTCRITTLPFDCDGQPVCDAGDDACLSDFFRRAEEVYQMGFLPQ